MHPLDLIAKAVGLWIGTPFDQIESKMAAMDDIFSVNSPEMLVMTNKCLEHEIKKMSYKLAVYRAVNTLLKDSMEITAELEPEVGQEFRRLEEAYVNG